MIEILSNPALIFIVIIIMIVIAMTSIQIISLINKSRPKIKPPNHIFENLPKLYPNSFSNKTIELNNTPSTQDSTKKKDLSVLIIEIEKVFKWLSKLAVFVIVSVGLTYGLVMVLGPKYEASSTLFVEIKNIENTPASNDSLIASNKIANNIAELTKKGEIVDEVIKLSTQKVYSRKELIANLRANTIRDTQLIEISVQNTDANEAQRLANVFALVVKDKYKNLIHELNGNTYIEIKIVQSAELSSETTFPSVKQAILLSTILATIIGIGTLLIVDLEKKNKKVIS